MKLELLTTDLLIWLMLATIAATAIYARDKEHLRAPWRQVVRSRMGVASLVILLAYVCVGVLDSFHFRKALPGEGGNGEVRYSSEVVSLLDLAMDSIRNAQEKTYSAPFAAYAYAKETVQLADGSQARIYPRLKYGGAHLQDPERQRGGDILRLSLIGLAIGLVVWGVLVALITLLVSLSQRRPMAEVLGAMVKGETEVPWRVVFATLGLLSLFIAWCLTLAQYYHILGTDKVGQDVFYQAIKSIRTGLVIGTLTTLVMLPFAVMFGIMAGYLRGWVDDLIQYIYTTLNSIPGILLIAASVLMVQVYINLNPDLFETDAARADLRLLLLCVILGIMSWTGLCRMLRGEVMKLREMDYVEAAMAMGVGRFKIMTRHLLPNVMHIVMISVVLDFSGLVLAEAVLSYVGVGVDPTTFSWGNMINGARLEMAREPMVWWSLLAAFVFMFVLVLAANLFSDAVRDAFDPRLRK